MKMMKWLGDGAGWCLLVWVLACAVTRGATNETMSVTVNKGSKRIVNPDPAALVSANPEFLGTGVNPRFASVGSTNSAGTNALAGMLRLNGTNFGPGGSATAKTPVGTFSFVNGVFQAITANAEWYATNVKASSNGVLSWTVPADTTGVTRYVVYATFEDGVTTLEDEDEFLTLTRTAWTNAFYTNVSSYTAAFIVLRAFDPQPAAQWVGVTNTSAPVGLNVQLYQAEPGGPYHQGIQVYRPVGAIDPSGWQVRIQPDDFGTNAPTATEVTYATNVTYAGSPFEWDYNSGFVWTNGSAFAPSGENPWRLFVRAVYTNRLASPWVSVGGVWGE